MDYQYHTKSKVKLWNSSLCAAIRGCTDIFYTWSREYAADWIFSGVTGKPIPPAKLYPGYGLVQIVAKLYQVYGLVYEIIANPYPGYNLATIYVHQTIPWAQFGHGLYVPKQNLDNFLCWVGFDCYT